MSLVSLELAGASTSGTAGAASRRRLTLAGATLAHGGLASALLLAPLLHEQDLPEAPGARAVLVTLPDSAPPPPQPPALPRAVVQAPRPSIRPVELVAPVEVPERIAEAGSDLVDPGEGAAGGVPGGIEGGVAGGVVGGLGEAPEPEASAVRVGGLIHEPRVLRDVLPEYPPAALAARVTGLVILELLVGRDGVVKDVSVLRADPLFAEAAVEAVRRRLYQPLLLNGVPMDFLMTVTVRFNVKLPHP